MTLKDSQENRSPTKMPSSSAACRNIVLASCKSIPATGPLSEAATPSVATNPSEPSVTDPPRVLVQQQLQRQATEKEQDKGRAKEEEEEERDTEIRQHYSEGLSGARRRARFLLSSQYAYKYRK